jgi:uncharacterized membrane protein
VVASHGWHSYGMLWLDLVIEWFVNATSELNGGFHVKIMELNVRSPFRVTASCSDFQTYLAAEV